jgi:hypothetical protein
MSSKQITASDTDDLEEIRQLLRERPAVLREVAKRLVARGLVFDTGERRDGEVVYGLTQHRN